KGGNGKACFEQLVGYIKVTQAAAGDEWDATAAREFAFEIASKVGAAYCNHESAPEPLGEMGLEARKKAAGDHPGLCGYFYAGVIAAVKTQDVDEKWGSTAGNKFRNQACFDGAVAMNARGQGVQLKRAECFTQACRALWPGNSEMDPCFVEAFSD
ncbi:unnamed protein product, partial [Hapterophycus canaliculatus]